ncbi:oligosaccharide flippase family protein [Novosphingobium sp. BL-8A]
MSVRGAAIWAMAGQYTGFIIQFVTSVLISRFFLSPAEVGLFSIAMAAALFVATFQDFGLSRYIAALPAVTKEEAQRCSTIASIFSFAVAGIIMAIAWPLAQFYGQAGIVPLLVIIGASYLFLPFSIVPMALMGRRMQFSHHFAVNVGAAIASCGVSLGLAAAGYSAFSLAWGTLAGGFARGLIAQLLNPALPFPPRIAGARKILSFGSKASVLYLSGALGSRTPDLIVGKFTTLFAVGLYSRATSLSEQFRQLLSGAVGSVFFPAFARIRDRGEPLGPAYLRVTAGYCVTVWPGMIALAVASEAIVRMLYGEAWMGVAPLMAYVSLASVIMNALPLVSELPILVGRMNRLIAYNLCDTALSIILLALGSLYWGVEGAAASRVVYAVLWFLIHVGFMRQTVEFSMKALFGVYAKSFAVTLAAVAPLTAMIGLWLGADRLTFPTLLLGTVLGGVAWLIAIRVVRHPTFEEISGVARSLPIVRQLSFFTSSEMPSR